MYSLRFKSIIDFFIALFSVIVFSPLFVIIIFIIKSKLGSPVFFKQERAGYKGKTFRLYKFRTMTDEKDDSGNLFPDERRLRPFGKFLRSTSLDELPELINILKGEMSLVGQRPLLAEYLPLYSNEQNRRHEVKPGITGWAQVNGRNELSWEEKFKMDVWYVDHLSFLLDIKIIILTLVRIIKREGISQEGEATMVKFTGNEV